MPDAIDKFADDRKIGFTFSQRRLIRKYLLDISIRERTDPGAFLRSAEIQPLLNKRMDPVEKRDRLFSLIRRARFPFTDGKMELFAAISRGQNGSNLSGNVRHLNSRRQLVNPYYYGNGIFNLKEHVLSLIRSCPMDCAYCFLREVYDTPQFKVAPDYKRIAEEIAELRQRETGCLYLNAGENADSLILDAEFGLTAKLWEIVKPFRDIYVEFRTKTTKIEKLIRIRDHEERIIPSFSINPEPDRALFETNTATIRSRIASMEKLQAKGFLLGIRLEPMVYSRDMKEKYRELFRQLFQRISPDRVHSISMGTLRLTKGLAKILEKSHPKIMAQEWTLCSDRKLRYCRPLRVKMYRDLLDLLAEYLPSKEKIIITTEPPEAWQESGLTPKTMPEICKIS